MVIEQGELTAVLPQALPALIGDRDRLRRMSLAARALARPDAAQRIADRAEQLAGRRPEQGRGDAR